MLASLAWGFLFSARETGTRLRPAWWLDLHKGLGGLALIFTVVHLVAAFADSDLGVGLARSQELRARCQLAQRAARDHYVQQLRAHPIDHSQVCVPTLVLRRPLIQTRTPEVVARVAEAIPGAELIDVGKRAGGERQYQHGHGEHDDRRDVRGHPLERPRDREVPEQARDRRDATVVDHAAAAVERVERAIGEIMRANQPEKPWYVVRVVGVVENVHDMRAANARRIVETCILEAAGLEVLDALAGPVRHVTLGAKHDRAGRTGLHAPRILTVEARHEFEAHARLSTDIDRAERELEKSGY